MKPGLKALILPLTLLVAALTWVWVFQEGMPHSRLARDSSPRNGDRPEAAAIKNTDTPKTAANTTVAQAAREADLPNLDRRALNAVASEIQQTALAALRDEVPGVTADFDRVTGTAKWIAAPGVFLDPGTPGRDAVEIVRDYVARRRDLLGHGPEAMTEVEVTRDDVTKHNGMRTLVWQQRFAGLRVFGARFKATVTRSGELVNVGSQLVPDLAVAASTGTPDYETLLQAPTIAAAKAVALAGQDLGEAVPEGTVRPLAAAEPGPERKQAFKAALLNEASVRLQWLPMSAESMRPVWDVVLVSKARGEMHRVLVDAGTGEALVRQSLTESISEASYRVFTEESPMPMQPTHPSVSMLQPAAGNRSLIVTPAFNTTASPNGWIDDGVNETRGNNVEAHTDRDGDNTPDLPRPQGSPSRVFDPPLNLSQDPANYKDAAVVQLFYYCNMIHDRFYELGFTESAGNFQMNNFGRGGLGNDPVLADAQDNAQNGSRNNANFQTPDDGSPGRMQMYVWTGPNPDRDGDFDGLIVVHEYAHGLTNRLVGGGAGITDWHTRGMGEGWSDFYGLALLTPASADPQAAYAKAGYSTYQLSRLGEANFYFGIRRYPYSVDTTMNPLRFGDIDLSIDRAYAEVPLNPNTTNINTPSVHREGEVWCGMLWDMRANLIARYGAVPGNDLALRLVTDALKLSPANPTFVQARDAILQADLVNSAGLHLGEIWTAFAKRKMGSGAVAPPGGNLYTIGAIESGTVPDALEVSNLDGWNFNLDPSATTSTTLTLRNTGTSSINWSATPGAAWLQASPASGSLAAGASVTLTVQASAAGLAPGRRSTMLVLRNEGTAFNQPVGARLNLAPPAVVRFNLETDPGWARSGEWAYGTPQGGGGLAAGGAGYPDPTVAATGAKVLGVNLSGNHSVAVTGPDYVTLGPVNLSAVRNTRLRFRQWLNMQPMTFANATIEVSTDGTTWRSLFASGYSGAADDAWRRMEYEIGMVADQQATVYVRWGHQTLASPTAYSGWNLDDIEILGEPVGAALSLTFTDSVNENAGPVTATLGISAAQASQLTVSLASADPSAATVPATVTIPANQTSVSFAITPVNDAVADGHQTATITATATGIAPVVKDLAVLDDESSTLVLSAPTLVTEGGGTVEASVRLTTASARDQVVTLQSDNAALTVTASVLIPANSTAPVTVLLNAPDNTLFEGPKTVQLTAAIAGWASASATVTVADDESPRLTLTGPATAAEGDTPRTLTVAINASLGTDLTVNLASSNTGKVTVASSVIIPAGQQSTTFSATIVNNALRDGSQPATVTASAAGYQSGALDLMIRDNDADSYTFAPIASPQRRNSPFAVTLTARDVNGEIIATPAGSVTLSGTATSGTVAFSPTAVGTFSNGVASVSPTFTAAATGIVLTATDNFGRTGQSNAFDVVTVPLDHFDWTGLPASGAVNALLNATVTGKDDSDAVSTGFNGSASLRAHVLYYDRTIGSPATSSPATSLVLNTAAQDSRAMLLYTAEELGGLPGWLGAISFRTATNGNPNMSNFTVRVKLTPRTTMDGAVWETDGWTTVYTSTSQAGGLPNFPFTRPFYFDGTSSLLVDISFDNGTTGTSTTLRYTAAANNRVLSGTSSSAHGNPLNWSAATGPSTQLSTELPAMDVYFARDLGLLAASPASFTSGVWSGQVSIPAPGNTQRSLGDSVVSRSAWMLATEASGAMGFSSRLTVNVSPTLPLSSSETIFSDNFESGTTLGASWSTAGSFPINGAPSNAPRAAISSANTPRGTQHLVLDSSVILSGFQAVLSAAEMSLNLAGRSNVTLEYWAKFMTGEVANTAPGTQPFTTSAGIFDGIAISADGTNWYLAAPTLYAEPLGPGVPSFILPTSYTAMRRVVLDPIIQRYGLSYNSTFRIKFLCVTARPAPDAGIAIDDVVVKANATTAPALELPAQFAEGGTQNITVRLPSAPAGNVTVNLVSNAPARLTVPASVTVLAGQTTATASVTAPNNGFLDSGGGFGAFVTVTASGYPTSYANTFITDNETGTLSLSLPAQILENFDPPTNDGTVSVSPAPTEDTSVTLTVSNTAEAFITGSVNGVTTVGAATIKGGVGSGRIHITPVDDARLDGQQTITVTASAPGLTSGSTTVLVNDNEPRTLSLNLPNLITEGGTGGASVIIPGSMTSPLTVSLASSNPSKLTVPATVTINPGNTASGFTITTLNDTTDDGDLAVFITASAATFTSGSGPSTVRDNDPSYFEFSNISAQAPGVAFPVTISARSSGNDLVTAYTSTAALSASAGGTALPMAPAATTGFSNGAWTGNVTVNGSSGAVRLTATRTGTGAFGNSNSFAVTAGKLPQTITFPEIPDKITTDTVALSASGGGSGNPVTLAVTAGPATINAGVLSFTGAGSVTVTASQAGNANFEDATSVSRSFTVTKATATVTLGNLSQTYDGAPKPATAATDPAGKTVVLTYDGTATAPTNAGSYAVAATINDPIHQGGANGTLQIAKASQAITFAAIPDKLTTDTVTLSATGGGSGNAVTFAVTGGPATINAGVLSFTGAGSVTVTASQAGNTNYEAAASVSRTLTVSKADATVTLSRLHQVADGTARAVVVTTVPEDLEVSVTYDGEAEAPIVPGSYAVVATSADDRYEGSASGTLVIDDPARSVVVPGGNLPALSALGALNVPTFSIGAYEITGSQWATVVAWAEANAGYDFGGAGSAASGDRPVTGISWFDAAKWCNARTERENTVLGRSLGPAYRVAGAVYKTGTPASPADLTCDFGAGGYRLPTAAEWEYAARGGASGTPSSYPGGNTLDALGWYDANSNGAVQPAGGKTANGLGLYDLAGNAAEWTWDAPAGSPGQRLLRGGAWSSAASACELSALAGESPVLRFDRSGFRFANSISLALFAALDQIGLAWESGGDEPWFAQGATTGTSYDGTDAAESGSVLPGQSSWLETSVTGPCNLRFRWEATQRAALDVFRLETGTGETVLLEGAGNWAERLVELPAGDHTLRWVYARDAGSTGTSRVRLDVVSVTAANTPTVTTAAASSVSNIGATLGGEVTSDGGRTVNTRGVVYATTALPTLGGSGVQQLTAASAGTGPITVTASGLAEGTTYHARAYATNSLGTTYGENVVFTTDTNVVFADGIGTVSGRTILAGDLHRFRFTLTRQIDAAFSSFGMDSASWELRDGSNTVLASGGGNVGFTGVLPAGDYVLGFASTGAADQAFSLTLDASIEARPKPDLSIGDTPAAASGADLHPPAVQSIVVLSRRAVARTIFAQADNDGPVPDSMSLRGSAGARLFAVTYFSGGANVTAQMIAGTHTTAVMDDDDPPVSLLVTLVPNLRLVTRRVRQGERLVTKYLRRTYSGFIEATAESDGTRSDTVRFQITTTK